MQMPQKIRLCLQGLCWQDALSHLKPSRVVVCEWLRVWTDETHRTDSQRAAGIEAAVRSGNISTMVNITRNNQVTRSGLLSSYLARDVERDEQAWLVGVKALYA
jgi:hypothetical protein